MMHKDNIHNVNINDEQIMITPAELKTKYPLDEKGRQFIENARKTTANIIHKRDPRLLIVCGPCSIHDVSAAKEYAVKLKKLAEELKDTVYIVMRVYFEKPRTTVGWKGLINDPDIDGTLNIEKGLEIARQLLLDLTAMEIPLATEALDPISPQYIADLFSWSAIGARTTESQTHRELASGLSMPVGFKNGTDGNLETAINALKAASSSHRFMGINRNGQVAILQTQGNHDGHVILRGGKRANYDSVSIYECEKSLAKANIESSIMVDCSHSNSFKDYRRQPLVLEDVAHQIEVGNKSVTGFMIESFLQEGNQSSDLPVSEMKYGQSITDACISWETTESILKKLVARLDKTLKIRAQL